MRPLKVAKPKPLTTRKREFLNYLIVESREKGCRSVPCVIVRHRSDMPDAEREPWLRPFERLALRFLVATEHDGLFRRVKVEAYHVPELLGEVRILGDLERPDEVRLDAALVPKETNRMLRHADGPGHRARTVAKQSFRWSCRPSDDPLPDFGRNRRLAPPSGQVGKPLDTAVAETIRPGLDSHF